jgi:K+-sensing histidine kinase KdpD
MLAEGMATDPGKQREYHQVLYRESGRLMHLVENVLSYARLEKGRYGIREAVAVGEMMDRMLDRLAAHAKIAGMEMVTAIDPMAGSRTIRVDCSAVERILFNLVDNACKYAHTAPDRRIHLEVNSDDKWVRITVWDHGPGIRGGNGRRLFRPFQKSAKEAAKSAPGVGIGLSLSRRLAEASGGRLLVEESAEGACLRLDLPVS